jgi:hypothetical protein
MSRFARLTAILALVAGVASGCGGSSGGNQLDGGLPVDGPPAQVDAGGDAVAPPDGAPTVAGHRGMGTMSGAVQAKSSKFRVVMTTGEAPGGGGPAASATYKVRTGVVGVTQGK